MTHHRYEHQGYTPADEGYRHVWRCADCEKELSFLGPREPDFHDDNTPCPGALRGPGPGPAWHTFIRRPCPINADREMEWVCETCGQVRLEKEGVVPNSYSPEGCRTPPLKPGPITIKSPEGIDATLAQRGARYGVFTEHARITQNLKRAMADSPNWAGLADDQREALEMFAHKIGRILNGDPNYDDSWVDIEGYSRLVSRRLQTGEKI